MNDEQLIELIANRVRARMNAGGQGPGYTQQTQAPSGPKRRLERSDPPKPVRVRQEECGDECGMCAVTPSGTSETFGSGIENLDEKLAGYIDHTLLKADATREDFEKLAAEARAHNFATVCVNSVNVRLMKQLLRGCDVPVCAVVGFPLGAMSPRTKAFETREAIRCGAGEIDMVVNIGALKSRDYDLVLRDIKAVVEAAKPVGVKVILETSKLSHEEKVIVCALSKAAGAAFVKTSTGFGGGGATVEDIELMRDLVGQEMGVKASGGVRSKSDAEAMVRAGANRIGASSSVAIVQGKTAKGDY